MTKPPNLPAPGLYDPEDTPEEDLWFLPAAPEDGAPTDPPWPLADTRALIDVGGWHRAEAGQGRALADAAAGFARLDARLRALPQALERLALQEVAALSWSDGAALGVERIALYRVLRIGGADQAQALSRADWAVRRLMTARGSGFDPMDDLDGFLGREAIPDLGCADTNLPDVARRPQGGEFTALSDDWHTALGNTDLHPISQAALAAHAWQAYGLSAPGAMLEAGVAAARIGAEDGTELPFLPLGLGGRFTLASGPEKARLAAWYAQVSGACQRALMALDSLEAWHIRAQGAIQDLSGRTPPALIEALLALPLLSAETAATRTGASKPAIRRNMATFEARGLIREVTGQGRYRLWKANA